MADLSFLGTNDIDALANDFYSAGTILPPGWYKVVITGEEIKDTSTGGKMLVFDYQFEAGDKIKERLNLVNKSEKAVAIAKSTLAKIMQCMGLKGSFPKDTNVLFGRPFEIKVIVEEYEADKKDANGVPTGEKIKREKNVIKEYRTCQFASLKKQDDTSSAW